MKKLKQDVVFKAVLAVVAVIVLCGLSFWAGLAYQKGHQNSNTAGLSTNQAAGFGGGRFRGGARNNAGTVTAINETSITIQTRSGVGRSFSISTSTTVTNNGNNGAVTDIKTGDFVIVIPSSSDANQADRILINPTPGSAMPGGSSGASTNSGSTDNGATQAY